MKISIELHSVGDHLQEVVTAFQSQACPSATLKRVSVGMVNAVIDRAHNAKDEALLREVVKDLDALYAKYRQREKDLYL